MANIFFPAFLWTVPIGAVLFIVAWLSVRQRASRSKTWRFVLSGIAALAVTPSVADFCGTQTVMPAVFFLAVSVLSESARLLDRLAFFTLGALPVVMFAVVIFFVWNYFVEKRRNAAS